MFQQVKFLSIFELCAIKGFSLNTVRAVAEDTALRCSLFRIITLLPSSAFIPVSAQLPTQPMASVAYSIRSLAWNVCSMCVVHAFCRKRSSHETAAHPFCSYFESKSVHLEIRRAEDVSGFGDDIWNAIGGLSRGLDLKAGRVKPLMEKAKQMSTAFSSALRSSFHDMFSTFRGGLLVAEASLCLRVLSCPAILQSGDRSWLSALPDLCLSIMDVCPGPVFEALADCMIAFGVDVFGPVSHGSKALFWVCKTAADAVCNDDLDTGAAAAKLLCQYFLFCSEQPSPFINNASVVLDIANIVRQNFVDSAVAASDSHALGHYM
jgi:hypothetical protein